MLTPTHLDDLALRVIDGLRSPQKRLPSEYFYDDEGSRLFQRIMRLPAYYLTEAEREILLLQWARLLDVFSSDGRPFELIELGSGDGSKTIDLCASFDRAGAAFVYRPIDVSPHAMCSLQDAFERRLPHLPVHPRVSDYFAGWQQPHETHRQIVLFMGSNLGNMSHSEARDFLRHIRTHLREGDGLLLGLDLMKNPHTVLAAYNDPQGVTAAFNLNLLKRMNRELGMDFRIDRFSHYATYSPLDGAARSFLVSLQAQRVRSARLGVEFDFTDGETIYTEQSQKYSADMLAQLARDSGFAPALQLRDEQGRYGLSFWLATAIET